MTVQMRPVDCNSLPSPAKAPPASIGAGKAPAAPGGSSGAVYDQGPQPGWATRTDKCARAPCLPLSLAGAAAAAASSRLEIAAAQGAHLLRSLLLRSATTIDAARAGAGPTGGPAACVVRVRRSSTSSRCWHCHFAPAFFPAPRHRQLLRPPPRKTQSPVTGSAASQAIRRSPLCLALFTPPQSIPSGEGKFFAFWCIECKNVFGDKVTLWIKDQSGGGTPPVQVLVSNLSGLGEGSQQTYCSNKVDIRGLSGNDVGGGFKECAPLPARPSPHH